MKSVIKFPFASVLITALVLALTPLCVDAQLHYLVPGSPDALTLLAPPPLPDSAEQQFDLAEVAAVQHACPSNELAEAMAQDRSVSLDYYSPIIGDALASGKLPATSALLKKVMSDASQVINGAKEHWKRQRPCVVDPTLLMGKQISSFSYPSGHSTGSMTVALVLAELYPDKRDALVAEARTIGWHRVQIARHFPTDVFAGRVLGQAIVRELMKSPDFQKDLAAAKTEIAALPKP